jgi:tRNA A-37 threonylcarbamoyl transferase component Bud32
MIGLNGEVKCPPRGHKNKNFVGKLIKTPKEFENIQRVSQYPEYEFMAASSLEVYRYQLIMPKIEGEELCSFLDKFTNEEQQTNPHSTNYGKELPLMDMITFGKLFNSLIDLYHFVEKLNSDGLYHNDISSVNVMYTGTKLTLIDFEHLSSTKHIFMEDPDMKGLESILSDIIRCAIYSPELKELIDQYNILNNDSRFVNLNVSIHEFVTLYSHS